MISYNIIIEKEEGSIDIINETNHNNHENYILLVDDEQDVLYTFDLYLKSLGFPTISFTNPIVALDFFNRNFTKCALVIVDYGMSEMSGLELIKKIREKDTDYKIKIIVISATVKNSVIYYSDKLSNLKIDKFLEKPIQLDKLKNEVEMLFI